MSRKGAFVGHQHVEVDHGRGGEGVEEKESVRQKVRLKSVHALVCVLSLILPRTLREYTYRYYASVDTGGIYVYIYWYCLIFFGVGQTFKEYLTMLGFG